MLERISCKESHLKTHLLEASFQNPVVNNDSETSPQEESGAGIGLETSSSTAEDNIFQCFCTVLNTGQAKFLMLLLLPSVSELNTKSMLLLAVIA